MSNAVDGEVAVIVTALCIAFCCALGIFLVLLIYFGSSVFVLLGCVLAYIAHLQYDNGWGV